MTFSNDIGSHSRDQDEFVIFAELHRDKFDEILQSLTGPFKDIQFGSQGDDWIWIHLGDDKIEIDSFYSMELDVKGNTNTTRLRSKLSEKWTLVGSFRFSTRPKLIQHDKSY